MKKLVAKLLAFAYSLQKVRHFGARVNRVYPEVHGNKNDKQLTSEELDEV